MPLYQINDIILNGKYRIEKLLGTGAFGEVYLATHVELIVKRAVKVLHRNMPGAGTSVYTEYLERFRQEAQIGARLTHENLVQVHDFEQAEDSLHLVMEYAQGGSLGEKLEKAQKTGQPISVAESIAIIIEIARGLAELHENQIIHRDLKPNNILFDKIGRAKVADLGLAQIPGGASMRSRFSSMAEEHPGTPAYMSPEQENTNKVLRPSSDIYALGLIWFEILSGKNYNLLRPGTQVWQYREDVDDGLNDLIVGMLSKDPEKRLWDGGELLMQLENLKQAQEQEKQKLVENQQREEEEKQPQKRIEKEQQLQQELKDQEKKKGRQEQEAKQNDSSVDLQRSTEKIVLINPIEKEIANYEENENNFFQQKKEAIESRNYSSSLEKNNIGFAYNVKKMPTGNRIKILFFFNTLLTMAIAILIDLLSTQINEELQFVLGFFGTKSVGMLAGPWVGGLTGLITVLLEALIIDSDILVYAPLAGIIGIAAGLCAKFGLFKTWRRSVYSGVIIGVAKYVAMYLTFFNLYKNEFIVETFFISLVGDIVTVLVSWRIVKILPNRFLSMFPGANKI